MYELIIITGIVSILAFALHGAEYFRAQTGRGQLSTALVWITALIAPFGALMGMLLFSNRMKNTALLVFTIVMLIAFLLGVYLLRGSL